MKVIGHKLMQAYMTYFTPKVIGDDPQQKGPCFSGTYIVTPESRFSVPAMGLKQVPLKDLPAACAKVITDKMGKPSAKDKDWFLCKADGTVGARDPYVDAEGDYLDGFSKDTWLLSGKKYPADINKSKCGQFDGGEFYVVNKAKKRLTAQDGELSPGDTVNVVFDLYAFDGKKARGCTATIEGVQKWATGERVLKLGVGSSGVDDDDFEMGEEEGGEDDAADLM